MIHEWLVCFGGSPKRQHWWDIFTRPGFRHVCAVACDANTRHWIFYDPKATGTEIAILAWEDPEVERRLGFLRHNCTILRVKPRQARGMTAPVWGCVPAIKSLVGCKSWRALLPRSLHDQLLREGAELVEFDGEPVRGSKAAEGRPGDRGDATP